MFLMCDMKILKNIFGHMYVFQYLKKSVGGSFLISYWFGVAWLYTKTPVQVTSTKKKKQKKTTRHVRVWLVGSTKLRNTHSRMVFPILTAPSITRRLATGSVLKAIKSALVISVWLFLGSLMFVRHCSSGTGGFVSDLKYTLYVLMLCCKMISRLVLWNWASHVALSPFHHRSSHSVCSTNCAKNGSVISWKAVSFTSSLSQAEHVPTQPEFGPFGLFTRQKWELTERERTLQTVHPLPRQEAVLPVDPHELCSPTNRHIATRHALRQKRTRLPNSL